MRELLRTRPGDARREEQGLCHSGEEQEERNEEKNDRDQREIAVREGGRLGKVLRGREQR